MSEIYTLDELKAGSSARITEMGISGGMRRRMQDIGFLDGVEVKCLFRGRSGEPAAFLISGAVIALRREEMRRISVCRVSSEETAAAGVGCASWV